MGRGVFTVNTESKEGGSFERREGTHTINKDQRGKEGGIEGVVRMEEGLNAQ